jgi:hypothetical protein
MEVGFVYIITTKLYEPLDIFKIGCTKDLDRRLKSLNATRTSFDQFYVVNCLKTFNYFNLETSLHRLLKKFRLKNEFFQCPLNTIEEAITEYVNKNVYLLHDDKISEEAQKKNLKWYPESNTFSIYDNGIEIFFNEKIFIQEITTWISMFDKYNLYQFLHSSHFDRIINHLKINHNVNGFNDMDLDNFDISKEMNKLFII